VKQLTQIEAAELSHAKARLLLCANHWVQKRVLTDLRANEEETHLFYAARHFSSVCEKIDPNLWNAVEVTVGCVPVNLDKQP
jgi:hypothetical protein